MRVLFNEVEGRPVSVAVLSVLAFFGALSRLDASNMNPEYLPPEGNVVEDTGHVVDIWRRVLSRACRDDKRIESLRMQIEVVEAKAKEGLAWPEPEVRLGWGDGAGGERAEAAVRFRIPDGADRRLVKRLGEIDVEWLESCIRSAEQFVELELWRSLIEAVDADARMQLEERRLDGLLDARDEQEQSGEDLLDRIRLRREQVDCRLRLYEEIDRYELAMGAVLDKGVSLEEFEALFSWLGNGGLSPVDLPEIGNLESQAFRNRTEILSCRREEEYVAAALDAQGKGWLPRASFLQLGWDEDADESSDDWQIKSGFKIDLFSNRGSRRLEAGRAKAFANTAEIADSVIRELREGVSRYERALDIEGFVTEEWTSIRHELSEGIESLKGELGSPVDAKRLSEEAYRFERRYLDARWERIKTSLEVEYAIGAALRSAPFGTNN